MKTFISRVLGAGLVGALALGVSAGTAEAKPIPARAKVVAPVKVVKKARPLAPSARHVWVPGKWTFSAGRLLWIDGYWAPPPRSVWVPGHYEVRAGRRVWVAGHWT